MVFARDILSTYQYISRSFGAALFKGARKLVNGVCFSGYCTGLTLWLVVVLVLVVLVAVLLLMVVLLVVIPWSMSCDNNRDTMLRKGRAQMRE